MVPVSTAPPFVWPSDDPLQDDALTSGLRVWQRRRGHRYSLDDVLTAHDALQVGAQADRYLDLGCGIGSVLLMVSERLSASHIAGVEAQEISFSLAVQNAARNGLTDRISLHHDDFRSPDFLSVCGDDYALITGTPPYKPPGTATPSPDTQRAFARMEYRGGVEDYLQVMGRCLAPGGHAVVCADGNRPDRVIAGAKAAGLVPIACTEAYPRRGRDTPLFSVWTLRHQTNGVRELERREFVAREANGHRTVEYIALREYFGLPLKSEGRDDERT